MGIEAAFDVFLWRLLGVLIDYATVFGPTPEFKGTSTSTEDPSISEAWWWIIGLVAGILFLFTVSVMLYYCRRSRHQRKVAVNSRQAHYAALLEEAAPVVSGHSLQTWEAFHPVVSIPVSDPLLGGAPSSTGGNYGTATPQDAPIGGSEPSSQPNVDRVEGTVGQNSSPPPPPPPGAVETGTTETRDASQDTLCSENDGRERNASAVLVSKCLVCLEARAKFALIPCGHLALCRDCQQRFKESNQRRCPVCRQEWVFCNEIYF